MGSGTFRVLDAREQGDCADWVALWEAWPRREVFAHPNYVTLFTGEKDRPLCAVWESPEGCVLYPIVLRSLAQEPYCGPEMADATDLVTPYGYGGPFFWGTGDPAAVSQGFWESFDRWAREQQVVTEFIRFSLFPEGLLDYPGERLEKFRNVVRDLQLDEESLWMDFEHKVRKNVKKAQRLGVSVERDGTGERLGDFLRIYIGTMERRDAQDSYRFPPAFFERIHEGLPTQFMYFHAVHEGKVVSTELALVSEENIYSFLGGTDSESFDLRPNDLLKYEIMLWGKSHGKRRFVLGGGYEPGDGIFRYKQAFAPNGCVPFFVGCRVLQEEANRKLIENRRRIAAAEGTDWSPREGFFPAYRA